MNSEALRMAKEAYITESECIREMAEYFDEEAYSKAAGVESYTRSAILDGGRVTVSEDISLDSEREIDFRLMTHREPIVHKEGMLELNGGVMMEYDPALEYTLESFVPANADPMARWGTPVLYRMHFKTKAKDYKCEFKYYKQQK